MLQVDIQQACEGPVPEEDDIRRWIDAALRGAGREADSEVSLRLVDSPEMTGLNGRYRNRTGDTNVLSFPSGLPEDLQLPLLGDIVICAPVVRREAREQGKPESAHWAHMTVHGTLHLLGYDHIDSGDADVMEALETAVLADLGYPCPYRAAPPKEYASR